MAYGIGIALALIVGLAASRIGFDRDRAFYPTVMIVIASYYLLFAVQGASTGALLQEGLATIPFLFAALAGFRYSLWLVVVALLAHGVFDLTHGHLIADPGVPAWWPPFCLAYDGAAAAYLAWRLLTRPARPQPA